MEKEELKARFATMTGLNVVSIDEFLPLAKSLQGYNLIGQITTNNNNDSVTEEISMQTAVIIMSAEFALSKKDADTGTTTPILADSPLRDNYHADITRENQPILRKPVSVFILNNMFKQMAEQRLGFYLDKKAIVKATVTRSFISSPSDIAAENAPIIIDFAMSGYEV